MSKKINSIVCPQCMTKLIDVVDGTDGCMLMSCPNCGSSVKINSDNIGRLTITSIPMRLHRIKQAK